MIFFAALTVSSLVINRGKGDTIADMGAPSLPRISFLMNDKEVNPLFGYVRDMDITAVRDTVVPLQSDGSLTVKIEENGRKISKIAYEAYSLDGEEKYKQGEAEVPAEEENVSLLLGNVLSDDVKEAVLKVMLTTEDNTVSYYTRIVRPEDCYTEQCLAFAMDFHGKAAAGDTSAELGQYLEPGEESDNTTYQTVNIHSDITHILWGQLSPEIVGNVEWSIKESNSVYTSVLAKYQAACTDENEKVSMYNIKEFFRVRFIEDTIYLLDYNRDMQEVFSGSEEQFDSKGILFGIVSSDLAYETNKDETMAAFVQERDLWLYDGKNNELTQVFSFADQEGQDVRSRNDQHVVRIISMDNDGNLAFAVYGYMNRGSHEGEVGVGIYYFDTALNAVEEKAFIPSTKSFAIAEDELGKMVYYEHEEEMLYVLADGTLYQIDLDKDSQTVLAENLLEEQYAVSDDGHLMAYETSDTEDGILAIRVMNLRSGDSYDVPAKEGETVRPLGFINGDFVYGRISPSDTGTTVSGDEITPMYTVEIRNSENKLEAEYTFTDQEIYTEDILIEDNLITFNRVAKDGDSYNAASQEYVTNNAERKETKISLQTYSTDIKEKQFRLTFSKGIEDTSPLLRKPGQIVTKKPMTITLSGSLESRKYYVYGMGELAGVYNKPVYAIQKAEQVSGVVISSDQAYVWEKGNRDLSYSTEASAFAKESGETSLQACERYMEQYNADRIDLTGCTLDQVLYIINRGCPMIAIIDTDHAVLLTGYTLTDIIYIDPDTGSEVTVGIGDMKSKTESSGNTFIGYIR